MYANNTTSPKVRPEIHSALIRGYSQKIRMSLKLFGLEGKISVSDEVQPYNDTRTNKRLMLGFCGTDESLVAILVSSAGASYNSKPIDVLLIPALPDGSLVHNPKANGVFASIFYLMEDNRIYPVYCFPPCPLGGINVFFEGMDLTPYERVFGFFLNGPKLFELGGDKIKSNTVLSRSGIAIPEYKILSDNSIGGLSLSIASFVARVRCAGFVVKATDGSGGAKVRLFNNQEVLAGAEFAKKLKAHSETVYVEERINPLEWKEDGQLQDWNVRAILTASRNPEWIDAEVRHQVRDNEPVNVCKHAKIAELKYVADQTGASIERIKRISLRAAKALARRARQLGEPNPGLVGLDLIVSQQGIRIIEANSGAVGGFSSLAKLRQSPLSSIPKFLSSIGAFLEGNQRSSGVVNGVNMISPSSGGHNEMSYVFINLGMKHEALAAARKAYQLKPDPPSACMVGSALLRLNKLEEAEKMFRGIIGKNPETFNAHNELGLCLLEQKRYAEAIPFFQQAIKLRPNEAAAHNNYGVALSQLERNEEAIAEYLKAIELDPNLVNERVNLGRAYFKLKQFEKAIEQFRICIQLDPKDMQLQELLVDVLARAGKLNEGIEVYRKIIESDPMNKHAVNTLGLMLIDADRFDEASEVYESALVLMPTEAILYTNYSIALCVAGKYVETVSAAEKAIALDPEAFEAYCNLGIGLIHLNRFDEAILALRKAIQLNPEDWKAHYHLAHALEQQEKIEEALEDYKNAAMLNPDSITARLAIGDALTTLCRFEEAIVEFQKVIEMNPEHAYAHLGLAYAFNELGKSEEAVAEYEIYLKMAPGNWKAWNNLGIILGRLGKFVESIEAFENGLEHEPNSKDLKYNLAEVKGIAEQSAYSAIMELVYENWKMH